MIKYCLIRDKELKLKKLIVFMAPPGAGKTELAEYLRSKIDNSIIINKDKFTKGDTDYSKDLYYQSVNRLLQERDCVILDSQNLLYQDRVALFNNIDAANQKDIKIIGIWIEVSLKEANQRNSKKPADKQPSEEEMDFLFKYKISPMPDEPFDNLVYIMRDMDIGMSKSYPYISPISTILDRIIYEN